MNKKKYYWRKKSGEKIDIDKMSTTHLKNTLKLILQKSSSLRAHTKTKAVSEADSFFEKDIVESYEEEGYDEDEFMLIEEYEAEEPPLQGGEILCPNCMREILQTEPVEKIARCPGCEQEYIMTGHNEVKFK